MSTFTEPAVAPEVRAFLEAVRARLADLDPDEQREILDGLGADLTDLVAERGGEALGDPDAYARELRTAAGFEPESRPAGGSPSRRSVGGAVSGLMDVSRHRFDVLVAKIPGDAAAVLTWLRPVWWVLRGWAAVQLLDMVHAGGVRASLVPDLDGLGWVLCLAAIVVSVAIGRGTVWPGGPGRGVSGRLVLLALNLCAVVVVPIAASHVVDSVNHRYDRGEAVGFERGYRSAQAQTTDGSRAGLYLDGTWVSNIYPYDAKGRPLVGIQLFNQIGQPIDVITQPEYPATELDDNGNVIDENGDVVDPAAPQRPRVYYPWSNGATQLLNVFPIPSRIQLGEEPSATAFAEPDPPTIGAFPVTRVPEVSLPGIRAGLQKPAVHE